MSFEKKQQNLLKQAEVWCKRLHGGWHIFRGSKSLTPDRNLFMNVNFVFFKRAITGWNVIRRFVTIQCLDFSQDSGRAMFHRKKIFQKREVFRLLTLISWGTSTCCNERLSCCLRQCRATNSINWFTWKLSWLSRRGRYNHTIISVDRQWQNFFSRFLSVETLRLSLSLSLPAQVANSPCFEKRKSWSNVWSASRVGVIKTFSTFAFVFRLRTKWMSVVFPDLFTLQIFGQFWDWEFVRTLHRMFAISKIFDPWENGTTEKTKA